MKKKKGFTLIELLAVIVILAIIALIAVPVIMNIISKARQSAFEDTAYGLISAGEMYYADKLLDPTGMTDNVTFTMSGGVFTSTESLNVSGSIPDGSVGVSMDGKVAIAINNGTNCITKGYNENSITTSDYEEGACTLPALPAKTLAEVTTTANACAAKDTTCAVGTQFAIKVKAGETHNFRVIADDGNNVTLIMEENLGDTVAWGTGLSNTTGPYAALAYIEEQTSEWSNIAPKTYTVEDENTTHTNADWEIVDGPAYTAMTRSNARARLIKKSEADAIISYDWSYDNLWTEDNQDLANGYWTSSAFAGDSAYAWMVNNDGKVSDYRVLRADDFGIRPVIEISK